MNPATIHSLFIKFPSSEVLPNGMPQRVG
jgi:hypothetical protein